jgi:signal peptidase II
MRTRTRFVFLALIAASTIGCDRVTKHVATVLLAGKPTQSFLADSIRLDYAENTGAFLSLGADLPPAVRTALFSVGTGAVLAVLRVLLFRSPGSLWRASGVALFVAGGLSNWVDRVTRGSVVDFMNVGIGGLRTGIFNVADMAILAGAAVFVLGELADRHAPKSVVKQTPDR